MELKPFVSILIPCFNASATIGRAIQSALDQTHQDVEIIVVNDGSTDDSWEKIISFDCKRLRSVNMVRNCGVAAAINEGFKLSKGNFIAALAADDIWDPRKIEKQLLAIRSQSVDAVFSWTNEIVNLENGPESHSTLPFKIDKHPLRFFLLNPNMGIGSTLLIKTTAIKGLLDENLKTNEDWEFFARLALAGTTFGVVPEVLTHCYRRKDGLSKTESDYRQALLAIEPFKKLIKDKHLSHQDLSKCYMRSAFWMLSPEAPKPRDAFILAVYATKNNLLFLLSREFMKFSWLFLRCFVTT